MKNFKTTVYILSWVLFASISYAHCQIPCGIYDDRLRIKQLHEDVETLHKSVKEINRLSVAESSKTSQQFVRWVNNKEAHAEHIITVMTDYFLTQRVKPSQNDYSKRLEHHHAVIINAMKVKQSSLEDAVLTLKESLQVLEQYYQ